MLSKTDLNYIEKSEELQLKSPDIKILKLISTVSFPPTVFTLKVRGKEIQALALGRLRPVWDSYTVR